MKDIEKMSNKDIEEYLEKRKANALKSDKDLANELFEMFSKNKFFIRGNSSNDGVEIYNITTMNPAEAGCHAIIVRCNIHRIYSHQNDTSKLRSVSFSVGNVVCLYAADFKEGGDSVFISEEDFNQFKQMFFLRTRNTNDFQEVIDFGNKLLKTPGPKDLNELEE